MVIVLQTGLRRTDTDMTRGSVLGQLVAFSVPLLIGNIFQQLYNTVDSVVVGNFVGKEALAAVGSVGPVINMLIGFFNGFATGAGVVISRHYGARQRENVRTAVQTTIAMTILMSIALSALGVVLTPALLRMMQTPEEVLAHASEYLQIYFAGLSGLLLYNMGAGILRAVGDTRRPLYFLIFSAVTNTVLDLLFVAVFHMGVAGVAIATILAQFASAALVLLVLTRSKGDYRIEWRAVRLDKNMLGSICALGLPSAVQLAVTAFSNIFVQSYINRFGAALMTGTTVEIDFVKACSDTILNDTLQRVLYEKMAQIGVPEITEADEAFARELTETALMEYPKADPMHPIHDELLPYTGQIEYECGSTDVGDVSWVCPTVQAKAATWAFGTPCHSWQAVTQGVMPLAHKMTLYIAKSLAAMGAELMVNAELLERAKQEHRRLVGPEGYVCPIPKGVKPRSMDSLHK